MKKTITLISALMLGTLCYSQTEFKLDSIHQYSWDISMNDWKHNTRDLYTYDNGGTKETNLLRLTLNFMTWENFYQYNKAYNGNNDLTESILQNWDGMMWIDGSRDSYTYNVDNLVQTFDYAINSGGAWITFNQNLYTYDTMGNRIEDLSKDLDFISMMLVNDQRKTYDFSTMQLNSEIVENWYAPTSMWDKDEKKDYTYNTNGDVSLEEILAWQTMSMSWSDPYRQYIITYNIDDQEEEVLEQLFASGMWINSGRVLTTYTSGKPTNITSQTWNSGTMMWDDGTRQLRTFDVDGNEIELIFENWNATTMAWEGFLRQVKFWDLADPLLSTDELSLSHRISVYPNPTSEVINIVSMINIETIELFDLLGKRVLTTSMSDTINVSHLPSGIYILKLKTAQGHFTKKVVID